MASPLAEFYRMMKQFEKEADERTLKVAKEHGFSSAAEYREHGMKEWRRLDEEHEKRLDEKCARLGKTREQLSREDPQRWTPVPYIVGEVFPEECSCDEHLTPLFCPKSLVDFKSQDLPDYMEHAARRHKIQIEDLDKTIQAKSRRLEPEQLEKAWVLDSPGDVRDVPYWAKADPVIRQILDSRKSDSPDWVANTKGVYSPESEESNRAKQRLARRRKRKSRVGEADCPVKRLRSMKKHKSEGAQRLLEKQSRRAKTRNNLKDSAGFSSEQHSKIGSYTSLANNA